MVSASDLAVGTLRPKEAKAATKGSAGIDLISKKRECHKMPVNHVEQTCVTFLVRKPGPCGPGTQAFWSPPQALSIQGCTSA